MAFRYFKCGDRILSQVCSAGLPTAIFSALMSISTIILNQILVAYGNALPATILSILRQGVLLIPVLYGLNALLGLHGVIYGQALTDYVAVLLSIVIWRWKRRKTL